ncbi:hypothetical protein D9757_007427 [Collybiopsis confluens]|uniref:DUF6533 domain-containing protein n=1 Tax=Collybiopsis confluens TaxID=2823264 RepID=A0A8H5HIV0_9AGAR|nr:hypothetical protein D9757_007427 [Collybiopsis confluens]
MLTLLTYHYVLSFSEEVAYVWYTKWGLVKVLYFYSRYTPFIDTILAVQEQVNPHISSTSCHRIMVFNTIFAGLGIGISDLILLVRTYAMYQNSRKVLVILIISWTPVAIVNIVVAFRWTSSLSEITLTGSLAGCLPVGENSTGIINYAFLLGGETIVVVLTMWQAFRSPRATFSISGYALQRANVVFLVSKHGFSAHGAQTVIETFYRDAITLGNIIVLVYSPPELQVLQTPMRVMHSILCCALIIRIREVATSGDQGEDALEGEMSSIDFRIQSVEEV